VINQKRRSNEEISETRDVQDYIFLRRCHGYSEHREAQSHKDVRKLSVLRLSGEVGGDSRYLRKFS